MKSWSMGLLLAIPGLAWCVAGLSFVGTAAAQPGAELPGHFYADSWAVIIGIDDYQHPRVGKLRYAVNDAQAVKKLLLGQGFRSDRLFTLIDRQATKARIETLLGDELMLRVGPDDRLLVFFAGHGKTDRLPRTGEEEGYLVPVDGDPGRLFGTAISMTALRQISERLSAKHILYVVDACYSGYALFNRTITQDLLKEMLRKPAIQILTAGRKEDAAQERGGHGVFTEVLLRGLQGDAFAVKDWMALEELGLWVKDRVFSESNRKQLPQYGNLSGEGQFVFLKPLPGTLERTRIAFPAHVGGRVGIFLMKPDGHNLTRLTDWVGHFPFGSGLSWSPDGRKVAFVVDRDGKPEIYVMDVDGQNASRLTRHETSKLGNRQLSVTSPAWSPDGARIAYVSGYVSRSAGTGSGKKVVERDIYVMNADGTNQKRLTTPPGDHTEPSWSPDGMNIVFASQSECHVMSADGTNPRRLASNCRWPAWSPDGTRIAYGSFVDGVHAVHVMNADGTNPRRLTRDRAMDSSPTWSPDGTKIAYLSGRGKGFEIYIMDADGANPRRLTDTQGGARSPSWSPFPKK